jgi:hypothetical protein
MFAQGGLCFFCKKVLLKSEASVEHLVASANGGRSDDENCVACCKAINALLGSMSLKEKIQVALNQRGQFRCPNEAEKSKSQAPLARSSSSIAQPLKSPGDRLSLIVSDLRKRGSAKPRTVKTLTGTISALFQKKLAQEELLLLLERLQTQGIVVVNGTKVSYALPEKSV